jgi:Tfp pilus assembly protein PilO
MNGADLLALVKKYPIAFACGVVCLLCAVAFYFRMDAIDEARTAFEAKDKEAKAIAQNARHTSGLAEQVAEMQAAGKQIESRLMHATDLANNLQFFYRLEAETGVKLVDARQNPIAAGKPGAAKPLYVPVSFSITLQGTYAQVWSFFRRLETGPHFAHFDRLALNKLGAGGKDASDQMNAVFTVELLGTP